MKVKKVLMAMLVGFALVGCNREDTIKPDEYGTYGGPRYMSISINTTGGLSNALKADEYENGLVSENTIEKVRLYFFDAGGTATNVKKIDNQVLSYYDYIPTAQDQSSTSSDGNVEKILNATIIIHTQDGDKVPTSIIAVVNPPDGLTTVQDTAELNAKVADYSSTDKFIMSSSVYAKDGVKMEAVSVAGHLYENEASAKANPVVIYVERVLAKARLTVGLTATANGLYKTTTDGSETFGAEEIYVKFLGWNVTATASKSYLIKAINPSWPDNLFGTPKWNTADYSRSFWAINPAGIGQQWGNFTTHAQYMKSFKDGELIHNYTYLQENASDNFSTGANTKQSTQVIIAAQLVDKNGNALEFVDYAGERTTIEGLKNKYASASGLWKQTAAGKKQIEASDIELKTATTVGEANQSTNGRYKVYAQLTDAAAGLTWYTSNAEDATSVNANTILKGLGGAKVWKNGYTYYYFDIKHFGQNIGNIGVVRNHVYAANITNLKGLGTPVYDPEETIYPEKPGAEDTYIAAEIRILSWRLVKQDISLEW